jgi:hypothetical protein
MADTPQSTGFSLRRWSQRKLAAARGEPDLQRDARDVANVAEKPGAAVPKAPLAPASAPSAHGAPEPAGGSTPEASGTAMALPPLESLTGDSDFSPFMQPGVDADVKRMALRKLLRDPRFNVMDGLDVYIDDYSKPSPIEPELVRTLAQARYIFDPPKTRVTAEGVVEDVPDEALAVSGEDAAADVRAAPPTLADARAANETALPPPDPADHEVPSATLPPIPGQAESQ